MRWVKLLSQFNFLVDHIGGKHNQLANALSWRPKVNVVPIASHNYQSHMIDEYAKDSNFKDIMLGIAIGKKEESFNVQDGFFLYSNRLYVAHSLCDKVM